MRHRFLTLTATAVVALAFGAGLGIAAAQAPEALRGEAGMFESMDEMHAAMRDEMPAGLGAECDEMHGSMSDSMREMAPGSMSGMSPDAHAAHHG